MSTTKNPPDLTGLGSLDPDRMYTTRYLARRFGYKRAKGNPAQNLEAHFDELGIPMLDVGNAIRLVRGRDLWEAFDVL